MASETGGSAASRNGHLQQPTRGALALHPRGATTTSARVNQATQLQIIVGLYERAQRYIFKVRLDLFPSVRSRERERENASASLTFFLFLHPRHVQGMSTDSVPKVRIPFILSFVLFPPADCPLPSFQFCQTERVRLQLPPLPSLVSLPSRPDLLPFAGHQTHANDRRIRILSSRRWIGSFDRYGERRVVPRRIGVSAAAAKSAEEELGWSWGCSGSERWNREGEVRWWPCGCEVSFPLFSCLRFCSF